MIISLKNQQEVYLVQDDEGDLLYQKRIQKYSITLRCRRRYCKNFHQQKIDRY